MAKLLKVFAALFLALAAILVALFIFVVKFQDDSPVARDLRHRFLKTPLLVSLVGLNRPGDLYAYYLDPNEESIDVYLASGRGAAPDPEATEWIQDMIAEMTGKSARIQNISNLHIPDQLAYTNADLNTIWKKVRQSSLKPALYVIYLTSYQEDPGYAGITLHRDTLFMFKSTIDTLSDNESTRKRIEQSTLAHEWGHLLGLGHTIQPDCLMTETVEVYTSRRGQAESIPVEHCWESLYELELLKKEVQ